MKVLLIDAVPKLGLSGDVKVVKDGYARNFLFPNNLAMLVNDPKARQAKGSLAQNRENALKAQKEMAESSKAWAGKEVELKAKATSNGTLFGAITDRDVAEKLELERKRVKMQPVKSIGEYEAIIDLGQGVDVRVKVKVVAEAKIK